MKKTSKDDKKSAPEVFSSCSFIPRAHFETSLVMISYYMVTIYYIVAGGQAIFK